MSSELNDIRNSHLAKPCNPFTLAVSIVPHLQDRGGLQEAVLDNIHCTCMPTACSQVLEDLLGGLCKERVGGVCAGGV